MSELGQSPDGPAVFGDDEESSATGSFHRFGGGHGRPALRLRQCRHQRRGLVDPEDFDIADSTLGFAVASHCSAPPSAR